MSKKYFLQNLVLLLGWSLLSCSDYTKDTISTLPSNSAQEDQSTGFISSEDLKNLNQGEFSEAKMIANIGLSVISHNVEDFSLQAKLLKNRVEDFCVDLQSGAENPKSESLVKNQWEQTMLSYHAVEAAGVGPLTENGRFLADNIYSWPYINTCGIDNDVASSALTDQISSLSVNNRKGLGALEYLLFTAPVSEKCNLKSPINKTVVDWLTRTSLQRKKDRCQRAIHIVDDLDQKAQTLWKAWDPQRGNYTQTLLNPSQFSTPLKAINALTDSLFAVEKIKDLKLAIPIGKSAECKSADKKCPEATEHIWSGLAFSAISIQLNAFKTIFYGSSVKDKIAFGFDDYLISKGHSSIVTSIEQSINEAIDSTVALENQGSLLQMVQALPAGGVCEASDLDKSSEPLCVLYARVRKVSNTFRAQILPVLALQSPASVQGDND